jgi:hypothetical protein
MVSLKSARLRSVTDFLSSLGRTNLLTASKFRFLGTKHESDRCRVHIYPLDFDQLRKEAENTLGILKDPTYLEEYGCYNGQHSDICPSSAPYGTESCIEDQIEAAQQRRNNLDTYYVLTDCARDPQAADGFETLKGMAQESPIIDLE